MDTKVESEMNPPKDSLSSLNPYVEGSRFQDIYAALQLGSTRFLRYKRQSGLKHQGQTITWFSIWKHTALQNGVRAIQLCLAIGPIQSWSTSRTTFRIRWVVKVDSCQLD